MIARLFCLLAPLMLIGGFNAGLAQPAANLGEARFREFGTMIRDAKWPDKHIAVCWENIDPKYAHFRAVTEKAVQETWIKAARGGLVVAQHWGACTGDSPGLRIAVSDTSEGAHTEAVGRYLDKRPSGMVLNFTFDNWSQGCQSRLDFCVYAVAAHEFGHALGFTHEQNRADAPKECRDENQSGSVGDYNVTDYDPKSIMNYCNPNWNGNGKLSGRDIDAVRTVYPN